MPSRKTKVFAAGCYNRLHEAHRRMLQAARSLGEELVVVLAHDAHNKKPNAVPAAVRLERMKRLGVADRVIVGRPDGFAETLRAEHPQVLVLGYDQRLPDAATAAAVREMRIDVVTLPWYPGKERPIAP